jgi:hypothetical protein
MKAVGLRLEGPSDQRLARAGTNAVGVSALGYVQAVLPDGEGRRLFAFVKLEAALVGQSRVASMPLPGLSLAFVQRDGSRWVKPGRYKISVDGSGNGITGQLLTTELLLTGVPTLVEESPF